MLRVAVDWLVYSVFHAPTESRAAAAIHFFIYDSLKILLLLAAMISVIGFLRTFLSQKKMKGWLSTQGGVAYFYAALFGAVTPFCSCSSIPIYLGFLKAGVPLGVTFSFLITSPLINEYLVVIMAGFFGWKITLLYIMSGMVLGMGAGAVLGKMNLERYLEKDFRGDAGAAVDMTFPGLRSRLWFGAGEAAAIIKKIWAWVLVGVAVGAVIHNYIPGQTIQWLIGKAGLFSVPLATLLGVPMYGNCAAIVPVAVVLFQKGVPLGTALSFMMAISALSFPEAVILRRAMTLKLIAVFFWVTAAGIVITGYVFNFLQAIISP